MSEFMHYDFKDREGGLVDLDTLYELYPDEFKEHDRRIIKAFIAYFFGNPDHEVAPVIEDFVKRLKSKGSGSGNGESNRKGGMNDATE